ncbi:MAG: hypothetical protein N3A57_00535 [Negativicutes bacterium]|nr:hypothetical protein [Negativicutes bacterium]
MVKVWLVALAMMIAAVAIKVVAFELAGLAGAVAVEVLLVAAVYLWLRYHRWPGLGLAVLVVGAMAVVNILVDLGLIRPVMSSVILLAVIIFFVWRVRRGGRPPRPPVRHKWHK